MMPIPVPAEEVIHAKGGLGPPDPPPETRIEGGLSAPEPRPMVLGDFGAPEPYEQIDVDGDMVYDSDDL
jgi:hypothetical protein